MKIYVKVVLALLICSLAACKKKRTNPEPQPEQPAQLRSITENYNGESATYLLSYNSINQLQQYQKTDGTEKFSYTYEGNRIKTIAYLWNDKSYVLSLNYSLAGYVSSGLFTATTGTGTPAVTELTCTQNGSQTLIQTADYPFILTVDNGNLVSAHFNAWYYKRLITFTYGNEAGIQYGSNLFLPNEEIRNPFVPQSQILRVLVQMGLQAFSKNNLTAVNSTMYQRSISYQKDVHKKVVKSVTQISKLQPDEAPVITEKQVVYQY